MPWFESGGHRLYYREAGRDDLLLILPGNTASSACHDGELAHFGGRYHAVALDFLGTGRSDRLDTWPDDWWERGACDAAALVRHLDCDHAIVVGTSGGAVVALLMAALHRERVRAVVADSCAPGLPPAMLRAEVARRRRREPSSVAFWKHAQGTDWEQVVETDSDLLLRLADRGGDWLRGRLAQIRCPVLFTASVQDESLPNAAVLASMVREVPGSEGVLVGSGSHPMMWSAPAAFRRIVDGFLAALPA